MALRNRVRVRVRASLASAAEGCVTLSAVRTRGQLTVHVGWTKPSRHSSRHRYAPGRLLGASHHQQQTGPGHYSALGQRA